jgi:sugar lactone lactonase YvrE
MPATLDSGHQAANWRIAVPVPALLGESPVWCASEQSLYYCDIAGHSFQRLCPATGQFTSWQLPTEVASCAPMAHSQWLLAMRDGLWRFDPETGQREIFALPPYNPLTQRFNDGKCDAKGRFWVGTLDDKRKPAAQIHHYGLNGQSTPVAAGLHVVNGLAWSPDGCTFYCNDTTTHTIYAFDTDPLTGALSHQRAWVQFAPKASDQNISTYAGRPDGAAIDEHGNYWVAMFEGQQLLCLSPQGSVLHRMALPVRCPTMPCFGGADLKTLYLTTSRHQRPEAELHAQPWAGYVLATPAPVAGMAAHSFACQ